jgi:hypothetical protein
MARLKPPRQKESSRTNDSSIFGELPTFSVSSSFPFREDWDRSFIFRYRLISVLRMQNGSITNCETGTQQYAPTSEKLFGLYDEINCKLLICQYNRYSGKRNIYI